MRDFIYILGYGGKGRLDILGIGLKSVRTISDEGHLSNGVVVFTGFGVSYNSKFRRRLV